MAWSDNPVRDAENYEQEMILEESRRDFILCDSCNGKIYRADAFYDGDSYYELEGLCICEDCLHEFLRMRKKECV